MMPSRIIIMSCLVLAMPFCPRFWMRLIGLANFPRHGIRVQTNKAMSNTALPIWNYLTNTWTGNSCCSNC